MRSFQELEEFWRSLMKLVRGDFFASNMNLTSFMASDQIGPYLVRLDNMIAISEKTERSIMEYINEQKRKFPKLYLYNKEILIHIFSLTETPAVFEKVKGMLELTGLLYDKNDPHLTIGAISGDETIHFKSSSSSRSSIVDWLRGIYLALAGRLKHDIREFMEERHSFVDEIRLMSSVDQARICAAQLKFWEKLEATNEVQMKLQLKHVYNQLRELNNMIFRLRHKNQKGAIFNMMVIYIEHRDLLEELLKIEKETAVRSNANDSLYNGGTDFILACHIQKKWVNFFMRCIDSYMNVTSFQYMTPKLFRTLKFDIFRMHVLEW